MSTVATALLLLYYTITITIALQTIIESEF